MKMRNLPTALRFAVLAFFLGTFTGTGPANAAAVTWFLQDWVFNDEATASGSFVFDADTNTYSNISVVTTDGPGPIFNGQSYSLTNPNGGGNADFFQLVVEALPDLTGEISLRAVWDSSLTNAGGTVAILFAHEAVCPDWECLAGSPTSRSLTSGFISTVPAVPIPAALPLFLSALVGIGLFGWRRRKSMAAHA